jgi:hypothetical protein
MPYDNEYNMNISNQILNRDDKYITHLQKMSDYGADNAIPRSFYAKSGAGLVMNTAYKGGYGSTSGFANGTFRDTGFDRVEGAGGGSMEYKKTGGGEYDLDNLNYFYDKNFKMDKFYGRGTKLQVMPEYGSVELMRKTGGFVVPSDVRTLEPIKYNVPVDDYKTKRVLGGAILGALEGGKKKKGRPSKMKGGLIEKAQMHSSTMSGFGKSKSGGGFDEFKRDLNKFDFNTIKDWIGLGKYHKMKGAGWDELKRDLGKFDMNLIKEWVGLGKKKALSLSGSGWDDFTNFFTKTLGNADTYKNLAKKAVNVADSAVSGLNKTYSSAKDAVGLGKKGGSITTWYSNWINGLGRKKGAGLDTLKSDLGKADLNRLKDYIGLGKKGGGFDEIKKDLGKADMNRLKDYLGLGKVEKREKEKEMMASNDLVHIDFEKGSIPKGKGKGKGNKRADIVKQYMNKHKCSMIEASKKVKELGLYKK